MVCQVLYMDERMISIRRSNHDNEYKQIDIDLWIQKPEKSG